MLGLKTVRRLFTLANLLLVAALIGGVIYLFAGPLRRVIDSRIGKDTPKTLSSSAEPDNSDLPTETEIPTEPPTAPQTEPPTTEPIREQWSVPSSSIAVSADAGDGYLEKIIFLGDSTTYGMYHYGILPLSQVWTRSDGTLALFNTGVDKIHFVNGQIDGEMYISTAAAAAKPELLVITLGVNGVAMMSEVAFKAAYNALISSILQNSPDTKLILNSIYPVTKSYEEKNNGINNKKIRAANGWIAAIAAERGVGYLDSYTPLADKDGYLKNAMNNGDGMHLTRAGLETIIKNVKTHAIMN